MTRRGDEDERWHVGKEIPLALMFTMFCAVASGVWYASQTDARIAILERDASANSGLRSDVIQIKEQVKNIDRVLSRVETMLDRRASARPALKTDKEAVQ